MRNFALALVLVAAFGAGSSGPAAAQGTPSEDTMASMWTVYLMAENCAKGGLSFTKPDLAKIKDAIVAAEAGAAGDAVSQAGYERAWATVQAFLTSNPSLPQLTNACSNARTNAADRFRLDMPQKPF